MFFRLLRDESLSARTSVEFEHLSRGDSGSGKLELQMLLTQFGLQELLENGDGAW